MYNGNTDAVLNNVLIQPSGLFKTLHNKKTAVADVAVDPAALYGFRRDNYKHRGC
ncbi:MAG: hypothetical protein GY947_15110 [Rhodobacteraceae bacterium]|nr:hypothetical protein [Paracoccaceae bacterium]